jgi:hypothetical protein
MPPCGKAAKKALLKILGIMVTILWGWCILGENDR